MSLRTRIALIASAAVAVAVLAIAITAYITTEDRLIAEVDRSLTDRLTSARAFGGIADAFGDRSPRRRGPFEANRGFDVLYVQLTDAAGGVLIPPGQDLTLPPFAGDPGNGSEGVLTEATVDGIHLRIVNIELARGAGTLQMARSLEEVDATLASLAWTLTLIGLAGIAGAAGLGMYVARSSLRPIGDLTVAAERVATTKELAERISVSRADELGRLAGAFNEMMEALEESQEQQRRLVRDAGHELRTPLTALRTNIELLAKAPELPDDERELIYEDLSSELGELTDLVNEVVDVAAASDVTEVRGELDLGQLAAEVVARYRRRASQPIALDTATASLVVGRRTGLERALGNLIDNAIKWSPPGSPIDVVVAGTELAVTDRGPGIRPDERERIFDRFYRAAEARTTPGSGLGLAIVKQVVDNHDGEVFVAESPDGGTVVGFRLPTPADQR